LIAVTERLYYTDPDLLEFTAQVVESGTDEHGCYTVLDRSAFYPTSGGQAFDTGTLNEVPVLEVTEDERGGVIHRTERKVGSAGDAVMGKVNKVRRRRHRQSHTAQHILSAAFHHLFGYVTASVHLGEEYSAIEFDVETVSDQDLRRAEEWANDIIADNVPVEIMFVDADEVDKLPMRKQPEREGLLRVIRIGDADYSACGGTHCRSSGGVGLIKITGVEKMRGRALVKYLCGDLAREDYGMRYDVSDSIARALTCKPADLPGKLNKLTGELKDARRDLTLARKELLPAQAERLAEAACSIGKYRVIVALPEGVELALAGQLACLVADRVNGLAVLGVTGRLVMAAAENTDLDAGQVARSLSEKTGLKGGGNRRQAQLGGTQIVKPEEIQTLLGDILGHA